MAFWCHDQYLNELATMTLILYFRHIMRRQSYLKNKMVLGEVEGSREGGKANMRRIDFIKEVIGMSPQELSRAFENKILWISLIYWDRVARRGVRADSMASNTLFCWYRFCMSPNLGVLQLMSRRILFSFFFSLDTFLSNVSSSQDFLIKILMLNNTQILYFFKDTFQYYQNLNSKPLQMKVFQASS